MTVIKNRYNPSMYILMVILILLPIDSALSKIIGDFSLVDYLVVLFIVAHLLLHRGKFRLEGGFKIAIIPLCYSLLTIIWSGVSVASSNIMYCAYFVMFLLLACTQYSEKDKKIIFRGIVLSIVCLFLTLAIFGEYEQSRLTIKIVDYIDQNFFASGVIIIISVLLLFIYKKSHIIIASCCILALLVMILLTGSRGSLLAILGEIVAFVCFVNKKRPLNILGMVIAISIIAGVITLFLPESIIGRFNIYNSIKDGGSGRSFIWKNMLHIFEDGTILTKLFGYGREMTSVLYLRYIGRIYSPHNVYIKTLVEGGIIGLALLAFAMFYVLRRIIKNNDAVAFAMFMGISISSMFLDMDNTRLIWFVLLFLNNPILQIPSSKKKNIELHSFRDAIGRCI